MSSKWPAIAVSQRVVEAVSYRERRDALDQAWTTWLGSLELHCVPVPNRTVSPADFLEIVKPAGIILSGGNDLPQDVYDGLGSADRLDPDESRDATERGLLACALTLGIPVLGCCRGMQFLQAYFGGRLARVGGRSNEHIGRAHQVSIVNDTFRGLAGKESLTVNSYHRYGIPRATLAAPLVPFAVSKVDSTVEGCFHPDFPIAGIMWHPERANPAAGFDRILAARLFVDRLGAVPRGLPEAFHWAVQPR